MKKLGKILALVLAAALVLSLVACGEDASGDKTLRLFGNIGSADGYSVIDEEILAAFKQQTGITVELEYVASSGYQEKLQLMLASGEYPDAAVFPSTTTQAYIDSVENGIVVELNEYLTEENAPNLMAYTYESAWEGVKFFGDDRIMAIPRTSLIRNEGIQIRADWLKAIGMGDILERDKKQVTADEFKEMLKRMTFNDPDGNGQNDTLGSSLWADDATKQYGPIEFARGFYGDYGWYNYEGEDYTYMMPQYSKKSDIYKNQLQYSADLYQAGYLDKDGPSLKKSDVNDKFNQGRLGVAPQFSGHIANNGEKKILDLYEGQRCQTNETYVDYIYAEDANGVVAGNGYYKPMWGQWCVFTTCADPNMFVKFCDFLLSDEIWDLIANGKEGVTYTMVDGYRETIQTQPGEQALGASFPSGVVRKAGDAAYFTSNEKLEKDLVYFKPYLDKAFQTSQETLVEQLDNGFTPTVASTTKFINYQSKMAEEITKICTGAVPVSEYDTLLQGWYDAGGQQYVEEMNEYIAKNQAQKAQAAE